MKPATPAQKVIATRERCLSKYLMILKAPTPRMASNTLYLSSLDQNTVRVYTQSILLFPFPDGKQAEAAITALSDGLRETLRMFPFLAGQLSLTGAGKLVLKYPTEIAGPRESSIFAKKNIPLSSGFPHSYEELKRKGMPPSAFKAEIFRPDDLLQYSGIPTNGEGIVDFTKSKAPALRVQANFIPGGLVLSTYYHHAVMDCSGIHNFWKWYAHHISTISNFSNGILDEPQVFPNQSTMRHDLDAQTPAPPRGVRATAEAYMDGTYSYPKTLPEDSSCSLRYFVVPAQRIRDFRDTLKSQFPENSPPTICNVLAALVWIHVTRARAARIGDCGQKETGIGIAIDMRRRMDPPLSLDYMGNMAPFVKGSMKIADLIEEECVTEKTIVHAIHKIKQTIAKVNNNWVQGQLTFFKSIEDIKDTECALGFRFGLDIYITSWMNFGADIQWGIPGTDLSTGSLNGRPDFIRKTYGPSDGGIMIMPRRRSFVDGKEAPYEVMVRLASCDMETLLNEKGGFKSWTDNVID
ncbi:trichothecene 3-O-acetyltransferas-like protein [Byssothecium circinans]|uniref:Trichothecene 3-O-acetyltransferas-like protein n=1 Tax=Byssothecium circinans TaxID=147558 RepID=A0A6A5UH81_9PLEO|nr:trichothecene 3-O-acetyltransferas-like protein [Byssothecium circinans]